MQRRQFVLQASIAAITFLLRPQEIFAHMVNKDLNWSPVKKPKRQWLELVSPEAYHILFEEGTEPPGSSPLDAIKKDGTFICAACYLPLFEASSKYDSGTGWPSFTQPIPDRIDTKLDFKLILPRTEYHCIRCGGHQGHVFKDGPQPLGLRYCNNGLALKFIPADSSLPELRG